MELLSPSSKIPKKNGTGMELSGLKKLNKTFCLLAAQASTFLIQPSFPNTVS